jgi:hypothetical protein
MAKSIIYYHRAYRKITRSGWVSLFEILVTTLPLSVAILFSCHIITVYMSSITCSILSSYWPQENIHLIEKPFLASHVWVVSVAGTFPSALTSLINFVVSLILMILLPRVKQVKNVAVFIAFLAGINLVSSVFFTLWPSSFPYTGTEFSELYVDAQVSIWIFVPIILGFALLPLPARILPKIFLIFLAIIYSFVFGTLRYILFLYVITKFSFIYSALLFFSFGPLIDFVYVVGIYCLYTSRLSQGLKNNDTVWKWLY